MKLIVKMTKMMIKIIRMTKMIEMMMMVEMLMIGRIIIEMIR